MNPHWITKYTPLFMKPHPSVKYLDLPLGSVVVPTGNESGVFIEVWYESSVKEYVGWVYSFYLEKIEKEFPDHVVETNLSTKNPNDAAQYILWEGRTQYNLCGEFCVAYIADDSIDNFLSIWKAKPLSFYKRIFGGGLARGTSADELVDMLNTYSWSEWVSLSSMLLDPTNPQRHLISPKRIKDLLDYGWKIIVSVKINRQNGDLEPTGILHWVVVTSVIPDEINAGWAEVYNPFPNKIQRYSWKTFTKSMGIPYGICAKINK